MKIEPGARVRVRTADGELVERRATSGVEKGYDFPVVWVCREDEWQAAQGEARDPVATPWPVDAVEAVEAVPA